MWLCGGDSYRRDMRIRTLTACTVALLLSVASIGPALSTPPAPADSVRADLDELIATGAVGALATLTDNGTTTVTAAGFADVAASTPVPADPALHVRLGSVTKSFTAAVALQLVAEGRVGLDRPVDEYLPGLLTGAGIDGRAITVRQVLGHRSGLPEPELAGMDEHEAARAGRTFTPRQAIDLALRQPARFAPGTRFEYANINYTVVGLLIEAVTGRPYRDELRDRILTPLALTGTYLPATGETTLRTPHPTGYSTDEGTVTDVTRMEPSVPWAAGALVSTGADLNRFYAALLAGQVVPHPHLRDMLDGVDMGNGDGMSYGLGLAYTDLPCGTRFIGHLGGVRGFTALSGATPTGRAATISFTGTPDTINVGGLLTNALCS